ncbi:MAG: hypothetical protein ABL971_10425 [Vicinamibacterales bacterium]
MEQNESPEDWKARWHVMDAWTVGEFAMLCCGWDPGTGEHPDQGAFNAAVEAITRAVRVGAIPTCELKWPARIEEQIFSGAPLFRPSEVSEWALKRFPATFPVPAEWASEGALDIRERTSLLRIIAALAGLAKIDLNNPARAAEDLEAEMRRLHVSLERRTIGKHLKAALEQLTQR